MKKINKKNLLLFYCLFLVCFLDFSQKERSKTLNFGSCVGLPLNMNKETGRILKDSLNFKQTDALNFSFFYFNQHGKFITNSSFSKTTFTFDNEVGKFKINQLSFQSGIGYVYNFNDKIRLASTINLGFCFMVQNYLLKNYDNNVFNALDSAHLNSYSNVSKGSFFLSQEIQFSTKIYKNYEFIAKYTYAYINPNTPKIMNNRIFNNINYLSLGLLYSFKVKSKNLTDNNANEDL